MCCANTFETLQIIHFYPELHLIKKKNSCLYSNTFPEMRKLGQGVLGNVSLSCYISFLTEERQVDRLSQ